MGTNLVEPVDSLPYPYKFKVHRLMCTELLRLVDRIAVILPRIEAARPRCSSGLEALCLLNIAIEKSKLILQRCSDSSKLYLAITGDVIVLRCQRSKNLLESSLKEIQTMVPIILASEISQIVNDLEGATFALDSSEEEAGQTMRALLQHKTSALDSIESVELKGLQCAAKALCLTSLKLILLERRSIKKLLEKTGDDDTRKKQILRYLIYLLKKYGNLMIAEQTENNMGDISSDRSIRVADSSIESGDIVVESNMLSRAVAPEEFKCPMCLRLMDDPVVIASGKTFDRLCIEKWFDENNNGCPVTKIKLLHQLLTPNTVMKDLISKWCIKYRITVPNPTLQLKVFDSDNSSASIASIDSSMDNVHLPLDISNLSLGSLNSSYSSESPQAKVTVGYPSLKETDMEFLSTLSELDWESQMKMVENIKSYLHYGDQACHALSYGNFVEPLINFLKDAYTLHDVGAQRAGYQLLLAFVSKTSSEISYLKQEAFSLFVSCLDSEVTEEVLAILEILSTHRQCISKISESGALIPIIMIIKPQTEKFNKQAMRILHNLSSDKDIASHMVSLGCISNLVPLLKHRSLAKYSISLLKALSENAEARGSIAESNECITSIAELLENGCAEEQENSVAVFLSLCTENAEYCYRIMDKGVIPALVDLSVNGTGKGKATAFELLRQLRDVKYEEEEEEEEEVEQDCIKPELDVCDKNSLEKKLSAKTPGFFFRMKFMGCLKPISIA